MTFIRVPHEITKTKWGSAKNFIYPSMSQLSVHPGVWGWRYTAVFNLLKFFALHPWKQWKVATLYHLLLLLGKPKQEYFRVQLTSQSQSLKYVIINCGTNNLDTDNPDEISDRLICIALLFQKRLKHLQIIVNGLIPRDAINTRRRQKLLKVNQLL